MINIQINYMLLWEHKWIIILIGYILVSLYKAIKWQFINRQLWETIPQKIGGFFFILFLWPLAENMGVIL